MRVPGSRWPGGRELCQELPNIELLVLNTSGTGSHTPTLVRDVRLSHPDLAVLHIGPSDLKGLPANVPSIAESFTAEELLKAARAPSGWVDTES